MSTEAVRAAIAADGITVKAEEHLDGVLRMICASYVLADVPADSGGWEPR